MFDKSELELIEETLHSVALQIDDDIKKADLYQTSAQTLENMWRRLTDIASKAGQMAVDLA